MTNRLNLQSVSFNDNVAYNCKIDYKLRIVVISFDWYYDIAKKEIIANPIDLVIRNWSEATFSRELHANVEEETFQETGTEIIPLYEILKMDIRENYIFLHAVAGKDEEDVYCYYKFYNASLSIKLLDMTVNENVYDSINGIKELEKGNYFIAHIPLVENMDELIKNLVAKTHVPPYLNCNWENLPEILCDPFWLNDKRTLAIVHDNISQMRETDFVRYLDVIEYCRLHSLRVFFIFSEEACVTIRKKLQMGQSCCKSDKKYMAQ